MSTLFVDQNSAGGDGSSWSMAYQSLSSALGSAQTGDEIWIAKGVYLPGSSRSDSFEIKAGVSVYGGFDGTEISLSERDWQQNLTILSGDIGTRGEDSDNSYHVVVSDSSEAAMLNGVIVEGGNTNGAPENDNDGSGIYNRQSLTIENVVVRGNQSVDDGGGIRNDGELLVVNSAIANNSATEGGSQFSGGGGLINTVGAVATILNSTFRGNQALNGGAIRNDGTLSLTNTTLSDNTGTQSSGGILNTISQGTPAIASLVSATVTQNSAPSSAGIWNFGSIAVANSIIASNQNDADFSDILFGSSSSNGNNIIGNGDTATGFTDGLKNDQVGTSTLPVNPLLSELQNNGGFTQTHLPGENSPAIDRGNNNSLPVDSKDLDGDDNRDEALPTDQRGIGFDRIFNNTVDIGAVEVGEEVANEPPSAIAIQPIVVSLPEDTDTSSAIKLAEITVTDPDEAGINQLSLVDLSQSSDSDIFEIKDNELFLKANTLLDFETQSAYAITLQVDDETVGNTPDASIDFDFLVTDVNDNEIGVLEPTDNQLLNASLKSAVNAQLSISVDETNTQPLSEVVVVTTDEAGQVNGVLPGEAGYLDALISESLSVLSTLEPGTFEGLDFDRQIALEGDRFLQFGIITGGTLDSLRRGGAGTFQIGPSISETLEGINSGILRTEVSGDAKVELGFDLGGGADFGDLILTAELQVADEILGAGLQGGSESELIDLRSVSGMVTADIMVYREAAFDNVVGLFTVENAEGQVRDQDGKLLSVGEAGYVTAALQKRVTPDLTGENGSVKTYSTQIAGGQLLSSFMVSNGAIADLLDSNSTNDPNIYFTHIGANSDGADHVRLLGNNTFGFEDLPGGGDQDFDDLVIRASFSPVLL